MYLFTNQLLSKNLRNLLFKFLVTFPLSVISHFVFINGHSPVSWYILKIIYFCLLFLKCVPNPVCWAGDCVSSHVVSCCVFLTKYFKLCSAFFAYVLLLILSFNIFWKLGFLYFLSCEGTHSQGLWTVAESTINSEFLIKVYVPWLLIFLFKLFNSKSLQGCMNITNKYLSW